ncbi:MAG: hypothetical protein E7588_10080 [Ruminococcaceae bacterium]|nr:hypothetical protein [Oscillospiraceae bacterium]
MIKIKIDGQSAHKLNTPVIASGAVNFLFLEAQFSPEWEGLNKSYIFTNGDVCIQVESNEDKVAVPHEVLTEGEFTVGIKGISSDGGERISVKATHNVLSYPVLPCGSDGVPKNGGTPSPTVAEQLREIAQNVGFTHGLIVPGKGEHSANAQNCNAIEDYSVALGDSNTAGRKAYYIYAIATKGKRIYLTDKQVTPIIADNYLELEHTQRVATPDYEIGDEFSIINGSHYILCAKITAIAGDVIFYDRELPFTEAASNPKEDDYTLCVPSKPNTGVITLGKSAFSAGEGNVAAGRSSFAAGRDNIAAGNFSAVFGRGCKAGYASLVSGFETSVDRACIGSGYHNKLSGVSSFVSGSQNNGEGDFNLISGYGNSVKGSYQQVTGRYNKVDGESNTVTGGTNEVSGAFNDISGRYHNVKGSGNIVHGYKNISSGSYQFITGQHNADDPDKALIVGWGSSEYDRKNIMSVDKSGNVYASGRFVSPYDDDYLYTFDNYRRITKFVTSHNQITLGCYDRCMKVVSTGVDPVFNHKFAMPLDGTVYPFIKLRYRIDGTLPSNYDAKIYFSTAASYSIDEEKRITFGITPDNEWHDIILDMSQVNGWDNAVRDLRFDIPNTSKGGVAVFFKYIGFFHDMDEAESFNYSENASLEV